jgi:RHS repeat-associated protein
VQKTLNVENSAADFDCPFRFCGMYEDAETGLCYNRHRYYDPSMGCYLSQDPIRLNGGAALYAYVHDPNSWVDVLGLAKGDILTEGTVYRSGNNTLNNYTPKLPKDAGGLSTFDSVDILKQKLPNADKAQVLDLSKLGGDLVAVDDGGGHVSIKPKNDIDGAKMQEWGNLKGKNDVPNPLAEQVQQARVGDIKCHS